MAIPIIISGGICTGKTHLLDHLEKHHGFPVVRSRSSPLLDLFWSSDEFHNLHLHECWELQLSVEKELLARGKDVPFVFLNGSWREDIWCYSRALYHLGEDVLAPLEWENLQQFGDLFWELFRQYPPFFIIYLTCQPRILLNRIRLYGRYSEKTITINHLIKLKKFHDRFVAELPKETTKLKIPVDDLNFYEDQHSLDVASSLIIREFELLSFPNWSF